MPAGQRARREHLRAQAQLLGDAAADVSRSASSPPTSHLLSTSAVAQRGLHRQLGDAQVLGGDAVAGVADDERDVGPLGRALRAQRRVVLDRVARPCSGGACRRCRRASPAGRPRSSGMSIASRVVPATSETITRSSPRKRLTSEDLPTFGRPMTASRTVSSSGSSSSSGRSAHERSSRSPLPRPCVADTAIGSPRPRRWNSAASARSRTESILFAATSTGIADAAQQVGELLVAGAHSGLRVDDEQRGVRRRRSRRAPGRGSSRPAGRVLEVDATVSTSVKRRPFHSQGAPCDRA